MKVPTYDSQVGLPGNVNRGLSVSLRNPAFEAVERAGSEVIRQGEKAALRFKQFQKERDDLYLLKLEGEFSDLEREFHTNENTLEGENAQGSHDRGLAQYDQWNSEFAERLQNDYQRMAWAPRIERRRQAGLSMRAQWEATQHQQLKVERQKGLFTRLGMESKLYANNPARLKQLITDYNEDVANLRAGHDNTALKQAAENLVWSTAIQARINGKQYASAEELLQTISNQGRIPADLEAKLRRSLKVASSDAQIDQAYMSFDGQDPQLAAMDVMENPSKYGLNAKEAHQVASMLMAKDSMQQALEKETLKLNIQKDLNSYSAAMLKNDYVSAMKTIANSKSIKPLDKLKLIDDAQKGMVTTKPQDWQIALAMIMEGKVTDLNQLIRFGVRADKWQEAQKEIEAYKERNDFGDNIFENRVQSFELKYKDKREAAIKGAKFRTLLNQIAKLEKITNHSDPKMHQLADIVEGMMEEKGSWFNIFSDKTSEADMALEELVLKGKLERYKYYNLAIPEATKEEVRQVYEILWKRQTPFDVESYSRAALKAVRSGKTLDEIIDSVVLPEGFEHLAEKYEKLEVADAITFLNEMGVEVTPKSVDETLEQARATMAPAKAPEAVPVEYPDPLITYFTSSGLTRGEKEIADENVLEGIPEEAIIEIRDLLIADNTKPTPFKIRKMWEAQPELHRKYIKKSYLIPPDAGLRPLIDTKDMVDAVKAKSIAELTRRGFYALGGVGEAISEKFIDPASEAIKHSRELLKDEE